MFLFKMASVPNKLETWACIKSILTNTVLLCLLYKIAMYVLTFGFYLNVAVECLRETLKYAILFSDIIVKYSWFGSTFVYKSSFGNLNILHHLQRNYPIDLVPKWPFCCYSFRALCRWIISRKKSHWFLWTLGLQLITSDEYQAFSLISLMHRK